MQKLIENDKVAVIFTPGWGAGWSTWGLPEDAVFDPQLARLVIKRNEDNWKEVSEEILAYVEKQWPNEFHYGVEDLVVEWLPVGTKFTIEENDGYERLLTEEELTWTA